MTRAIKMKYNLSILIALLFCSTQAMSQGNCTGWGDGMDSVKTRRYYEEYRKFVDKEAYNDALFFWSYVYRKAPGATKNVFLDGVKIYKYLYENESNPNKKINYLTEIGSIFDQRAKCLPDDLPNVLARKALEYRELNADLGLTYQAFSDALKSSEAAMPSFAIVPMAEVVAAYYLEGGISEADKNNIYANLEKITTQNIVNQIDKDNYHAAWVNVKKTFQEANIMADAYGRLAADEHTSDCYSVTKVYKNRVNQAPDDEQLMMKAINELKALDCDEANRYAQTLMALQEESLRNKISSGDVAMKSGSTVSSANFAFKNGEYEKAVELYETAANETADLGEKATYHLQMAKIYYSKLEEKQQAKMQLLKVLTYEPNNGKAYLLLGDIYYAAAKECFPTDLFDQKMVIFAAIDKWNEAKEKDAALAEDANERISRYTPYLPSQSEMFLARSRFKGSTYKLESWIDEKVKVKNLK